MRHAGIKCATKPRGEQIPVRLRVVLEILLTAWDHAADINVDPWDFAEEISALRAHGATNADLRYLLAKRVVAHAAEITRLRATRRKFKKVGPLMLPRRACFVLTPEGELIVRSNGLSIKPKVENRVGHSTNGHARKDRKPTWFGDRRELCFGTVVVKRFRRPAPNQETILAVFQEEGWPVRIDDPLTKRGERDSAQCLHDTINHLNRNQAIPLVRFFGDGTGKGVRWELRPVDGIPNVESDVWVP